MPNSFNGSTRSAITIEAKIAEPSRIYIKKWICSVGGLSKMGPLMSVTFDRSMLLQKLAPHKFKRSSLISVLFWGWPCDKTFRIWQFLQLSISYYFWIFHTKRRDKTSPYKGRLTGHEEEAKEASDTWFGCFFPN